MVLRCGQMVFMQSPCKVVVLVPPWNQPRSLRVTNRQNVGTPWFCFVSVHVYPKPILRSVWSFVHKSLICWPPLPEKLIDSLEIVDGCGTWTPGDLKDDLSRNFWRHEENGDYPMDEMRFPNIFRFQTPNPAFRIYQVLPCPAMFWRYHKSLQTRGIHNRFASQVLRTSLGCRWHWC